MTTNVKKTPLAKFAFFSILSFLLATIIFPLVIPAKAATLTSAKTTITDSRAGQTSVGHTMAFTTATTGTIASVRIEYCTTASGACTMPTGLVTTGGSQGTVTGLGASTSSFATNGLILLTVTSPASINSGTAISLQFTGITNPTGANSTYFVRIQTRTSAPAVIDEVTTAFAILTSTSIAMTATVEATLAFSLAPVYSGTVNSQAINVTSALSASTIPFGVLSSGSTKVVAHDATVTTNAAGGYTVTVKAAADPPLADGSNNIDYFTADDTTPTTWSSPAGGTSNVNTGFVGYTTEDTTLGTGTPNRFSSNKWAGLRTTAYEVMYNGTGVSSQTIRLGWQAEVNNLQPPGSYTGTVILVATPTY